MARKRLNRSNFVKTVSQDGIVVVDCWAPWCGACKQFSPIYASVANRYSDYTFAKLNTQAEESLTRDLGIENVPTLMVFRDGVPVFCEAGNYTEDGLVDIIEQAKSLDIDVVKKHMAARNASAERVECEGTAHACH